MSRLFRWCALLTLLSMLAACGGEPLSSLPPGSNGGAAAQKVQPSNPQAPTDNDAYTGGVTAEATADFATVPDARTDTQLRTSPPPPTSSPASTQAPSNQGGLDDGLTSAAPPAAVSELDQLPQTEPNALEPTQAPNSQPAPEFAGDSMFFQNYGVNPFVRTSEDALSTFAMDVDTASYTLMRTYIESGQLPPADSVRVEEYLNYFNYRYPAPETGDFAIYAETSAAPFGSPGYELVSIGIQAREVSTEQRKPAALTFVIDVSGSMAEGNRLGTVKQALELLVGEMREDDTIAIAVYGTDARAILKPTRGSDADTIMRAINELNSEGSTNVEAGLRVGFNLADEAYKADGINMIILCSDGVANNGVTDASSLLNLYQPYLDQGIQLSTYGFGMGNFNDILMEKLADAGNGSYAYVDSLQEARRVFVENLTGSLQTIARDSKIQVEFNPALVEHYRLVGYENRDIADVDFRNDTVDAGEVGAGHSVTALYEIKRVPDTEGTVATVRIRYQPVDGPQVIETAVEVSTGSILTKDATSGRFKLAAAVTQFAELMRHSQWTQVQSLDGVVAMARTASADFPDDASITEFVKLVERAAALAPPAR